MTIAIDERTLLAQLLNSPRLPQIAREIEEVLTDESAKRQKFYDDITEGDKAEYINGEIILHSPAKLEHNECAGHLYRILSTHVMLNNLGFVGYEKIMISLSRNDYEPDLCYFRPEKSANFDRKQMLFPAPDLIVEVLSPSTESNDRGVKFRDYAEHEVQEYWMIDPDTEVVEQYRLMQGTYGLVLKSGSGEITSLVLPEFTIPIRAIFDESINGDALRLLIAK